MRLWLADNRAGSLSILPLAELDRVPNLEAFEKLSDLELVSCRRRHDLTREQAIQIAIQLAAIESDAVTGGLDGTGGQPRAKHRQRRGERMPSLQRRYVGPKNLGQPVAAMDSSSLNGQSRPARRDVSSSESETARPSLRVGPAYPDSGDMAAFPFLAPKRNSYRRLIDALQMGINARLPATRSRNTCSPTRLSVCGGLYLGIEHRTSAGTTPATAPPPLSPPSPSPAASPPPPTAHPAPRRPAPPLAASDAPHAAVPSRRTAAPDPAPPPLP